MASHLWTPLQTHPWRTDGARHMAQISLGPYKHSMKRFSKLTLPGGLAAIYLVSAGCTNTAHENAEQGLTAELAAEIEGVCRLPAGALSGKAPVPDAMPKIACAVGEARKRNVAIGFISNPVDPDS